MDDHTEPFDEMLLVLVIPKDVLTLDSSHHDMVEPTGRVYPCLAWHEERVSENEPIASHDFMDVPWVSPWPASTTSSLPASV